MNMGYRKMFYRKYLLNRLAEYVVGITETSVFCSVMIVSVAVLVPGCGKPSDPADDYPPPGHMVLVSMEEAGKLYKEGNLIENGNFSLWQAEAPVPDGFSPPKNNAVSNIVKRESRGGAGTYSVDQYWNKSDSTEALLDSFLCFVKPVLQGKIYELSVDVRSYDDTTASLFVVALDQDGKEIAYWPDLIKINPGKGDIQTHSARIRTQHTGSLAILSRTNADTRYRARIVWLEWRCFEVPLVYDSDARMPQPLSR